MEKKWRTLQPPHQSEKFTLEEAMEAWRRVEAEMAAEQARGLPRRKKTAERGGRSTNPEVGMVKWRTIQPAHKSENITVQQAMKAWRKVEGKNPDKSAAAPVAKRGSSPRTGVVADRRK